MKSLFVLLLTAIPVILQAQTAAPISAFHFKAEGRSIYKVEGCVPGSSVSFCSDKEGSQYIGTFNTDLTGSYSFIATSKAPVFALNNMGENKQHIKGHGTTAFYGNLLFTLDSFNIVTADKAIVLKWNAATDNDALIFHILRSKDNVRFDSFTTIPFQHTQQLLPYTINEPDQKGYSFYKMEVMHKGHLLYTTAVVSTNTGARIGVYPTLANDRITIAISPDDKGSIYKVIDGAGKTVQHGTLPDIANTISVNTLPAGNYVLIVGDKIKKSSEKFVKL